MSYHNNNGHVSSAEFERAMQSLERQINAGFERTDNRLENIETSLTGVVARVAVLEEGHKTSGKKKASWTAAIIAIGTVIAEVVRRVFVGG